MNIQERAAKVLQEIDAALALAEKATKGPWTVEKYTNYHGYSVWGSGCCIAERWYKDAVTEDSAKEIAGDSAFIAASRTGWPTALRCLKTAIEGMFNAHAMLLKHDWDAYELTTALSTLCDQWESK